MTRGRSADRAFAAWMAFCAAVGLAVTVGIWAVIELLVQWVTSK